MLILVSGKLLALMISFILAFFFVLYSFIISQIQHLKSAIRISDRNRVGISQIHHLSLSVVYQNVLAVGPLPLRLVVW